MNIFFLAKYFNSMKLLLKKFRIPVSDVILIPDIMSSPCSQTKSWFGSLTQDLVLVDGALICPTGSCKLTIPLVLISTATLLIIIYYLYHFRPIH